MAKFWWQKSETKRGIHWCTWEALCQHKEDGGLRFRDMAKFNVALLAKQSRGWLLTNSTSLVGRVLRAKYYSSGDFLSSALGSSPSYIWRSIWSVKGLLQKGASQGAFLPCAFDKYGGRSN
ncbi:uncharacterized mitochondrial protein AtMg00310-like [Hibiscus syriacus]|uniref:uncharacterized mitochondrial protein AtMg00310-like n=1 Tax=Hibiscus syriacus TaxID=106335 RepID=UPI001923690B|nr:uncharacterized mitochondrial protein AtMg00310-like [Hibiscus syriacus]